MAGRIEGVKPTRMELLKLKRRVILAKKGHKLLKEKRDALIMEFFALIDRVRDARTEAENKLETAFEKLIVSQALMGVIDVKEAALACGRDLNIDVSTRNIMGVVVPVLSFGEIRRKVTERGYSLIDTSVALDEAAKAFEEALESVIRLAEIEESVKLLALEVEKTKRRVNALEYVLIPRLERTARYIDMRLEEMERDNFIRLKKIKASLEARKLPSEA